MKLFTNKQKRITISVDMNVQSELTDRFFDVLKELLCHNASVSVKKPLFIPDRGGLQRIRHEEILYLEAERNYCSIHLITEKIFLVSTPLVNIARHFLTDNFVRIHRSYVINMEYLEFLIGSKAVLINGIQLPINKEFKKDIYHYLEIEGTKSKKHSLRELL